MATKSNVTASNAVKMAITSKKFKGTLVIAIPCLFVCLFAPAFFSGISEVFATHTQDALVRLVMVYLGVQGAQDSVKAYKGQ